MNHGSGQLNSKKATIETRKSGHLTCKLEPMDFEIGHLNYEINHLIPPKPLTHVSASGDRQISLARLYSQPFRFAGIVCLVSTMAGVAAGREDARIERAAVELPANLCVCDSICDSH